MSTASVLKRLSKKTSVGDGKEMEVISVISEIVGWHHPLSGHEFEQTPGDRKGQGSLASCSPWGCTESNMTEQLNNSYIPKE